MKKILRIYTIVIVIVVCIVCPRNGYSQKPQHVCAREDTEIKFWYSKQQLIDNAKRALCEGKPFMRFYVKGKEFTEEGDMKISSYPDSRLILKVNTAHKKLVTKCVIVDPRDTLKELAVISDII